MNNNNDFNLRVKNLLDKAVEEMKNPSYSFCLRCADNMNILEGIVLQIKNLTPLYSKRNLLQEDFNNKQEDFNNKNDRYLSTPKPIDKDFSVVYIILLLISYILIGYSGAATGSWMNLSIDEDKLVPMTILWPLSFVGSLLLIIISYLFGFLGSLFGGDINHFSDDIKGGVNYIVGCFKGLFIAAVLFGIVYHLIEKPIEKHNKNKRREFSNYEEQMNVAKNAVFDIQNKIADIQHEIASKENEINRHLANISW